GKAGRPNVHGTTAPRRLIESLDQLALDHLRVLQHRWHVEHLAGGNAVLVEERRPFLCRARGQRLLDLGIQLEPPALALLALGEAPIARELVTADQTAARLHTTLP